MGPRQYRRLARGLAGLALCGAAVSGGGCATMPKLVNVTEDHTVRLVSRPVSAPAELVWRVKTFSRLSLGRMHVRHRRFPRLARRLPVPDAVTFDAVPDNTAIAGIVRRLGESPVRGHVTFLVGGDAVFPRLEADLGAATERIDIQTYIFDNDAYAVRVADLLRARDADGVRVRILLDMIGTRHAWQELPSDAAPSPHGVNLNMIRYLRRGSGVQVRRTQNMWLSSDHVKFICIDGRVAYLGGMNIGWEYRYQWRDMMSVLTGPVVHALDAHFESAWRRAGWLGELELLRRRHPVRSPDAETAGMAELHFLVTTPWRHRYFRAMLDAIAAATHRIYMETPYLWNKQIQHALCTARHRGVDVRVVMPMETNITIAKGADRIAANTLLQHGVRVFLYPGMTHKKAVVIDNWAFWGSSNQDDLSLHKNMELNLATADPATVATLEQLLVEGQDAAAEVLDVIPTGLWDRLSDRLTNLL